MVIHSRNRTRGALLAVGLAAFAVAFSSATLLAAAQSHRHRAILEVSNSLAIARTETAIELPLADVLTHTGIADAREIIVEDGATGRPLPFQLYGTPGAEKPDRILVLVSVGAKQTIRLAFRESGIERKQVPLVFGRLVPERKDDFAWENDKVAYRVYGPALEATGEISSGIDVWSKRVPALIINDWYHRDAEGARTKNPALSYHKDDGTGLDSYDVGRTRGCGGTGVWANGKLYVSKNFTSAEIFAAGPLRISFELEYAPWDAAGTMVSEKKIITLDAGSHLNRIESTLTFAGVPTGDFAVGLAMHKRADVSSPVTGKILSVWEPLTDATAGFDGTAIVMPNDRSATVARADGNALLVVSAHSGEAITYFSGAAWSKSDMPSQQSWNEYLSEFHQEQQHPLALHWK